MYTHEQAKHILTDVALSALGLALGLLVPGGGWLAAAALVANAGLSAHQAINTISEYLRAQRGYELGFIDEEPSLWWVGLAVAGAALDAGTATTTLLEQSAAALKALKGPLLEFVRTENLRKLVAEVNAVPGAHAKLKARLEREAKLWLAERTASRNFAAAVAGKTYMFGGLADLEVAKTVFHALWTSIGRKIARLTRQRALDEYLRVSGPLDELDKAIEEANELIDIALQRGMDVDPLLVWFERWAERRGDRELSRHLLEDMSAGKPPPAPLAHQPEAPPAGYESALLSQKPSSRTGWKAPTAGGARPTHPPTGLGNPEVAVEVYVVLCRSIRRNLTKEQAREAYPAIARLRPDELDAAYKVAERLERKREQLGMDEDTFLAHVEHYARARAKRAFKPPPVDEYDPWRIGQSLHSTADEVRRAVGRELRQNIKYGVAEPGPEWNRLMNHLRLQGGGHVGARGLYWRSTLRRTDDPLRLGWESNRTIDLGTFDLTRGTPTPHVIDELIGPGTLPPTEDNIEVLKRLPELYKTVRDERLVEEAIVGLYESAARNGVTVREELLRQAAGGRDILFVRARICPTTDVLKSGRPFVDVRSMDGDRGGWYALFYLLVLKERFGSLDEALRVFELIGNATGPPVRVGLSKRTLSEQIWIAVFGETDKRQINCPDTLGDLLRRHLGLPRFKPGRHWPDPPPSGGPTQHPPQPPSPATEKTIPGWPTGIFGPGTRFGLGNPRVAAEVFRKLCRSIRRGREERLAPERIEQQARYLYHGISLSKPDEFGAAFKDAEELVTTAQKRGMDDETLAAFAKRWAEERDTTELSELLREMEDWTPAPQTTAPAEKAAEGAPKQPAEALATDPFYFYPTDDWLDHSWHPPRCGAVHYWNPDQLRKGLGPVLRQLSHGVEEPGPSWVRLMAYLETQGAREFVEEHGIVTLSETSADLAWNNVELLSRLRELYSVVRDPELALETAVELFTSAARRRVTVRRELERLVSGDGTIRYINSIRRSPPRDFLKRGEPWRNLWDADTDRGVFWVQFYFLLLMRKLGSREAASRVFQLIGHATGPARRVGLARTEFWELVWRALFDEERGHINSAESLGHLLHGHIRLPRWKPDGETRIWK